MARVLSNYQTRHGLYTIEEMITRWAPPSENITGAYVKSVSQKVGIDPHEPFNVSRYMLPMVKAIIYHENGEQPYEDETIIRGIKLARV